MREQKKTGIRSIIIKAEDAFGASCSVIKGARPLYPGNSLVLPENERMTAAAGRNRRIWTYAADCSLFLWRVAGRAKGDRSPEFARRRTPSRSPAKRPGLPAHAALKFGARMAFPATKSRDVQTAPEQDEK